MDKIPHLTGDVHSNLKSRAIASDTESSTRECTCGNSVTVRPSEADDGSNILRRPRLDHVLPHGLPPAGGMEGAKKQKEPIDKEIVPPNLLPETFVGGIYRKKRRRLTHREKPKVLQRQLTSTDSISFEEENLPRRGHLLQR